jgi:endonuclease/exonuclease/phosphatase (EEP) superfamily protein YafD
MSRLRALLERVRSWRATTVVAWAALVLAAAWTLVRGAGLDVGYPLIAVISLTPWFAVGAIAVGLLALLLRRPLPAAGLVACALVLGALVLPRAMADDPPSPRPDGAELRAVAANLLVGSADVDQLADLVANYDADVLVLSELTPGAAEEIAASPIGDALPHAVLDPRRGSAGTGLMSRYPLERLPAPGRTGKDLPTVIATVEMPDGTDPELYAIHPDPPNSVEQAEANARYLDSIPAAPESGAPRLLIGDFNATLDDSHLRDLVDRGYTDVADACGDGLAPTWPRRWVPPPVTIDHAIVDERVEALDFDTAAIDGTDHWAIAAAVRLPSPAQLRGG